MAYMKYRPESVEFYAPDSFERDSLTCSYVVDNGLQLVTNNGDIEVSACIDSAIVELNALEKRVKALEDALAPMEYAKKHGYESRLEKLRKELKTLRV